jgi:hypothetical protein
MIKDKNITYIQARYRGLKAKQEREKLKLQRAIKVLRIVRYLRKYTQRKKAERAELARLPDKATLNRINIDNMIIDKAASKIQQQWRDHNSSIKVINHDYFRKATTRILI